MHGPGGGRSGRRPSGRRGELSRAGGAGGRGRPRPTPTGPAEPQLGVAYPFDLYTHCGIQYAQFGGRRWEASPSRPEPPSRAGSDGVTRYTRYTAGTMTLVGTDVARFVVDLRRAQSDEPVVTFFPTAQEPPACG